MPGDRQTASGGTMRAARGERGQILPIVVLALVALLGVAAFAIDVGFAYYAKRQLQSATDAAALAGAQDLPNVATAIATATSYAAANTPPNLGTFQFTYQAKCTNTSVIATGCNAAVNPNALVVTGTATDGRLVRPAVRHRPLRRLGARERLQPVLVDAGRHRDRDRPHGLDVHAERARRRVHRPRQRQGRRAHDAGHPQPAQRAGRHGGVPAGADDRHRPVRRALQLARRQRLRRLRQSRPRLRDRHDQRHLQDRRRRLDTVVGPLPAHRGRHQRVLHPGRRQHVLQRGAAPGAGRARRARASERARLHRLPDRRRGQHRQRLRPDDPPIRRATPTTSSRATPPSTSPTPTRPRA